MDKGGLHAHLGLAGLRPVDEFRVGGAWSRPLHCELVVEPPEGSDDADEPLALRWRRSPGDEGQQEVSEVGPKAGFLVQFAKLATAEPQHVLRFADKYGPLDLCPHGLPRTHLPSRIWKYLSESEVKAHRLNPAGWQRTITESLTSWRAIAGSADALLRLAADAKNNRIPKGDWSGLSWLLRPTPEMGWRFGYSANEERPNVEWAKRDAWAVLTAGVRTWLDLADVRFSLGYTDGRAQMLLTADSLFGAVGVQLALLVAGSAEFEFCTNCGRAFVPAHKRTQRGKNPYCDAKECRGAISRDAKRRRRAAAANSEPQRTAPFDTGLTQAEESDPVAKPEGLSPAEMWSPDRESNPGPFHYE